MEENNIPCPGCGHEMTRGMQVCWDCFKYRTDTTPLKYFNGNLEEWIKQLPKKGE